MITLLLGCIATPGEGLPDPVVFVPEDGIEWLEPVLGGLDDVGAVVWMGDVLAVADADRLQFLKPDGSVEQLDIPGIDGSTGLAVSGSTLVLSLPATGELWRVESEPELLVTDLDQPSQVVCEGDGIWWLDGDALWSWSDMGTEGGQATMLTGDLDGPFDLAVVDGVAHVSQQDLTTIVRVDPESGELVEWVDPPGVPQGLAVTPEGGLVHASQSTRWPYGGWVHGVDVVDGGLEELSYSPPEPTWVVADEHHVYWSSKQSITRVARSGGTYELVAMHTAVGDLAVDASGLAWSDTQQGAVYFIGK